MWIKLTCLAFLCILCCFTVFEAVLKHFQRFSTGCSVPLEKKTRLAGSESNHHTAKAKIFMRNERSLFKSWSAKVYVTRFPVGHWFTILITKAWKSLVYLLKSVFLAAEIEAWRPCPLNKNCTRSGWDGTNNVLKQTKAKIRKYQYRIKISRVRRSFVFYGYTHSLTHSLNRKT